MLVFGAFLLSGIMLSIRPTYAQFTSGFVGTAVDPSGAAIPNARVVITNQATSVETATVTSSSGDFRVAALLGGTYRVRVEAPGFQPWTQSDLVLEFNQVKTLYPVLAVSEQKTTVEVKSTVAAVTLAKSDTSREIDEKTLDDAPLFNRNVYTSIVQLAPGITGSGALFGGAATYNDSFEQEPAFQINAAGQRQENNEYQVDGTSENSASRDGVVNLTPEPDFVQAIRVSGANFSASKGRYSGALVQVYTKAGTNALHGSLSEYHTDNILTGRTIFETCPPGSTDCHAVPVFRRNEFGGSLGGPIIKNRLFIYGGLFILRSAVANDLVAPVPTPAFTQWVSQNLPNNLSNTFFTKAPPASAPMNGFLTVSQLEAQNPGEFPAPANLPGDLIAIGTGYFPQSPSHDGYQWHVRGDYNFNNDSDRLFFDWFNTWDSAFGTDPHPIYRTNAPDHGVMAKIDWIHTFSPTLLNEASVTGGNADGFSFPSLQPELPNASITGVAGYAQWGPAGWVHDNFNWHDVLTWTHGKHTIETGIDVDRHHDLDHFVPPQIQPTFSFANLIDFAQDLPYAQYGPTVDVATGALANDLYERVDWLYSGGFVQDDFRVTPHFTLNLGARFDYYGHWGNFHNSNTPFPMFSPGSGSSFADQIASGSMSVRGGAKEAFVADDRPHGFSPRVGFGWDVFGNGKTALRGGYGLFYNNVADGSYSFAVRAAPPFWAVPDFSIFNAVHPAFSYGLGNSTGTSFPVPAGLSYQVTSAGGLVGVPVETYGVIPHVTQPRTQNWMFAIQHDLGHNFAIEADYNGSHSDHLFEQTDVNRFPGDLIINNGIQTRLNPNFGPIIYGQTVGTADGHYGTIMLTKRFSHTWQLRSIFTFGKATDELSSNDNGTNNSESVFNPQNFNSQHGLADFDVARRFTLDSVWEIPTPFKSGPAKAVLGGWRMSHILILETGLPFTVYTSAPFDPVTTSSGTIIGYAPGSGDYNADGYDYDVPNQPAFGNFKSTNRTSFINGFAPASAFPVPALGSTGGNLGRNTFSGPGMANVNSEFTKAFRIPWFTREGASFEIRADIFNLFNRVNLTPPISDLSSSLFGMSTGQNLPRSAQFGIHIGF
jgi:hypothetical protein